MAGGDLAFLPVDRAGAHHHGHRLERLTQARPQGAHAGLDVEQGAMGAADDTVAVGVEVGILAPGHGHPMNVRAGIAPGVQGAAPAYHQHRIVPLPQRIEAARFAVRNFLEAAEVDAGAIHAYEGLAADGLNAGLPLRADRRATTWRVVETGTIAKNRR